MIYACTTINASGEREEAHLYLSNTGTPAGGHDDHLPLCGGPRKGRSAVVADPLDPICPGCCSAIGRAIMLAGIGPAMIAAHWHRGLAHAGKDANRIRYTERRERDRDRVSGRGRLYGYDTQPREYAEEDARTVRRHHLFPLGG